jgi:hypothetical protein
MFIIHARSQAGYGFFAAETIPVPKDSSLEFI